LHIGSYLTQISVRCHISRECHDRATRTPSHQRVVQDTNHMQLLSSPAVFEQLRDWLRH